MLPDAVLLVDDEAIVLDVLSIALKKKKIEVVTASRVADAMAAAQSRAFGCLIIDKNLPDGSGLEVIEKVRLLQPACACILMTGYPNVDTIVRAMQLGAVDYLEKPFPNIAIIQEKVLGVLARQKVAAERDALIARVQELQAKGGQEDFQDTAQIALLQQALEIAQEDAKRSVEELRTSDQQELDAVAGRLDAIKFRHQRLLTAVRQASASLANLLDSKKLPLDADRDLREARRLLSSALDDSKV
jgi:DNA-binding NtrC family response regulator